ncbi:MAG: hypothetical protein LUH20_08975 [Lachnospiraceae bacterium]|nr:hypothetical protein [Lachnospiraceae bacterium]
MVAFVKCLGFVFRICCKGTEQSRFVTMNEFFFHPARISKKFNINHRIKFNRTTVLLPFPFRGHSFAIPPVSQRSPKFRYNIRHQQQRRSDMLPNPEVLNLFNRSEAQVNRDGDIPQTAAARRSINYTLLF